MSLLTMLESSCSIFRATVGKDANQGTTLTYDQTIQEDVPCSQQEHSAHTAAMYAQMNAQVPTTFYFMDDPEVQAEDQIIATNRFGVVTYYTAAGKAKNVGRALCPWAVEAVYQEQPTT